MLKRILCKVTQKSLKSVGSDNAPSDSGNEVCCTSIGTASLSGLNVVKRMSAAIFPTSIAAGMELVEPNLSFNHVPNGVKQNLFISKLNLCCEIHDFSDPDGSTVGSDLKRDTLLELLEFVSSGSAKFTESAMATTCKMCAVNLFRVFPPKNRCGRGGSETEDEEPMYDPAWSHLHIVYELLHLFISNSSLDIKVAKKYVDCSFVLRLLELFDSDDPREREFLKTIMHRIYAKFMVHRPFIRKAVSNIIYSFVFETERHNGIAELLEIFGCVISGFSLPLSGEHKMFLCRVLIPLHKPKSVGVYHQELTYCIVQFIEKEKKLAGNVVKGLLKFWPVTNSQKEIMFLSELEEVLEMSNLAEFQAVMVPLFQRLARCLNSSHYQVAERAHFLWNNEHILNLIMPNREVILPIIIPALEQNTNHHWNRSVLNLTLNLKKKLCLMDQELVLACESMINKKILTSSLEGYEHGNILEIAADNLHHLAGKTTLTVVTSNVLIA